MLNWKVIIACLLIASCSLGCVGRVAVDPNNGALKITASPSGDMNSSIEMKMDNSTSNGTNNETEAISQEPEHVIDQAVTDDEQTKIITLEEAKTDTIYNNTDDSDSVEFSAIPADENISNDLKEVTDYNDNVTPINDTF